MNKTEERDTNNSAEDRKHRVVDPNEIIAKHGPKRTKRQPLIRGLNDLATVNPEISAEWHPTKNGDLTPSDVKAISTQVVWWQCAADNSHVWENKVTNRNTGHCCQQCGQAPVQLGINDLATVNPELAAEWHPTNNGKLTPETVKFNSRKKAYWLAKCGHEFRQIIGDRNAGNACPVCTGRILISGVTDLATVNPEIAKEWHPTENEKLTPQKVRANDSRVVSWQCSLKPHHNWKATVKSRHNGSLCPHCPHKTSKAEDTIREYIESLNYEVLASYRDILPGRKEIDIFIPSLNFGVEFNGVYWHSEGGGKKDTQYHFNKWSNCHNLGVELVQIWEDDWVSSPELVLVSLSRRLAAKGNQAPVTNLATRSISKEEAETFLNDNEVGGFKAGTYYHGSVDAHGELQSVLVLDRVGSKMDITHYVSNIDASGDLKELLQHVTETHGALSFTVTVDNCNGEGSIYRNTGFSEVKVEPAHYKYLVRGKRISSSEYTAKKFREDPALEWKEGFTEIELADLNGLNRIWDAGTTTYELEVV